MSWEVGTTDTFDDWFEALNDSERSDVIASMLLLAEKGPLLGRPHADKINGS